VQPLDLSQTAAVPDDASVVVVAGPAAEFFEAEVEALANLSQRRRQPDAAD
jgi:hypothetical protein